METPADRIMADIRWLADPAREGRGVGTPGLVASGEYIEKRYKDLGLAPGGDNGFRQTFPITTGVNVEEGTSLKLGTIAVPRDAMTPVGYSASGEAKADLVLAGYGISSKDLGVDDYAKLNVKGKIVVVRRFVPEGGKFTEVDAQRRYGDIRYKAWTAREKGAKALIVVDAPVVPKDAPKDWKAPDDAPLPSTRAEGYGDAGLPVSWSSARRQPMFSSSSPRRSRCVPSSRLRSPPPSKMLSTWWLASLQAHPNRSACRGSWSSVRTTITWVWADAIRSRRTSTSLTSARMTMARAPRR